jgi:2-hydroxy-6-oxonona-2,4-dienedioate hydrolase
MSKRLEGHWRLAARATLETRRRPLEPDGFEARPLDTSAAPLWVRCACGRPSGYRETVKSPLQADFSRSREKPDQLAVVLVHGVVVSGRYLMPLALELAREFPVLVPDLPGYGLSGQSPDLPGYGLGDPPAGPSTLAGLADAVVACARAAGHERVALVGNSFGAQIAVEAARRHPGAVERLVLIGLTVDPAARSFPRQLLRWLRCAPDEHLSVLPVMARDLVDMGARRAIRLLRAMLDDRPEEKLPELRQPTLVVRGGRDRICPAGWARRAAELLPNGRLATIPGYAHMPNWSGPRSLAPPVREFLRASRDRAELDRG